MLGRKGIETFRVILAFINNAAQTLDAFEKFRRNRVRARHQEPINPEKDSPGDCQSRFVDSGLCTTSGRFRRNDKLNFEVNQDPE